MAYDYEAESSRSEYEGRHSAGTDSPSYQMALVIWIAPAFVTGLIMIAVNLWKYDTVIAINYEADEILQTQQRTAIGRPYVLASVDPAIGRWSLCGFGVCLDGIVAFAAVVIIGATSRFVAAFVNYDVNRPIQKQVQRLFRGRPQKATRNSRRASPSGPQRTRRPRRPSDE